MPETPDEENQYHAQLSEVRFESFIALRAGVVETAQRIPMIINEFLTPRVIQDICDLPEVPTVGWFTTTSWCSDDSFQSETLQYCELPDRRSRAMIGEAFPGDSLFVWFEGEKTSAWIATGKQRMSKLQAETAFKLSEARRQKFEEDRARKEKDKNACCPWPLGAWDAARAACTAARAGKGPPEPWFPIIVNDFMTPEKVQKICELSSPPEIGWLTTAPFETDYARKPERLQYCAVQGLKSSCLVRDASHGESILVWFEGKRRGAWLASEKGPEDDTEC